MLCPCVSVLICGSVSVGPGVFGSTCIRVSMNTCVFICVSLCSLLCLPACVSGCVWVCPCVFTRKPTLGQNEKGEETERWEALAAWAGGTTARFLLPASEAPTLLPSASPDLGLWALLT